MSGASITYLESLGGAGTKTGGIIPLKDLGACLDPIQKLKIYFKVKGAYNKFHVYVSNKIPLRVFIGCYTSIYPIMK